MYLSAHPQTCQPQCCVCASSLSLAAPKWQSGKLGLNCRFDLDPGSHSQGFARYKCDRRVSVRVQGVQVSWTPCESSHLGQGGDWSKPSCYTGAWASMLQRESVFVSVGTAAAKLSLFFCHDVLPAPVLQHFLSPQTYQRYENVQKTLLLQILAQLCQQWQCKEILHGASYGPGSLCQACCECR